MTHEEALDRVQKLLRLAKSDNANEAAVAAAMAQKIIDTHKFDTASLETEEIKEQVEASNQALDSKTSTWKIRLAMMVSSLNNCKVYIHARTGLFLIGKKSDTNVVRYMYQWLVNETERLVLLEGRGLGKTWYNNFRLGVVEILSTRLVEEKKKTEAEVRANAYANAGEEGLAKMNSAIVKVNDMAAVNLWTKQNLKLKPRQAVRSTYDNGARQAGREAGATVNLGSHNRNLNAGNKALVA